MSGGYFDNVSTTDPEGVPGEVHDRIIEAVAAYPFPGAAEAAVRLWGIVQRWRGAAAEWASLQPLLKAVEWDHSNDWGPEDVERELARLSDVVAPHA